MIFFEAKHFTIKKRPFLPVKCLFEHWTYVWPLWGPHCLPSHRRVFFQQKTNPCNSWTTYMYVPTYPYIYYERQNFKQLCVYFVPGSPLKLNACFRLGSSCFRTRFGCVSSLSQYLALHMYIWYPCGKKRFHTYPGGHSSFVHTHIHTYILPLHGTMYTFLSASKDT